MTKRYCDLCNNELEERDSPNSEVRRIIKSESGVSVVAVITGCYEASPERPDVCNSCLMKTIKKAIYEENKLNQFRHPDSDLSLSREFWFEERS